MGRDHPRSRGVYETPVQLNNALTGSSPLARGLRAAGDVKAGLTGIIPARAGFTWTCPRRSRRRPDHPRSRGVYPRIRATSIVVGGSSPLARGLLEEAAANSGQVRIIPARAGFTGGGRS